MPTSTTPKSAAQPQPDHGNALYRLPLSQEALESLIPFPMTIYTRDGLYVGANTLIEQLFRVPKAVAVGNFNLLTDPSTQHNDVRALFQSAAQGQRVQAPPIVYDFSFPGTQNPARTQCWIETTYFPFSDDTGAITHVGSIMQDVTERVLAEQVQREREAELRLAKFGLDRSTDSFLWIDASSKIVYANDGACEQLGYAREELLELKITDIDPVFPVEQWSTAWESLKLERNQRFESLHRRKDGVTIPVEITSNYLAFEGHEYASTFSRDISERQRTEAELQTFKALVENAPDGVGICDLNGTMLYANPAYQAMLGYGSALVGMNAFSFIVAEDHARAAEALTRIPQTHISHLQVRYQHKDGRIFPVSGNVFCQELPGSEPQIIGFVRDISEQQRAEAEREQLQQDVIIAQQAALRELSTPLIPITDEVVAMPLIGSIDSGRAQLVLETLLTGVAELRADTTILDITGVPVVDTQVANALMRAAQAVRLLGARVILTGIRPEVAQTLVNLGVDLSGIVTRGTLQSGIAEALGRTGASVANGRR